MKIHLVGGLGSGKTSVLINARVHTDPSELLKIIHEEIGIIKNVPGCTIAVSDSAAFQPGYPRPTYRIVA